MTTPNITILSLNPCNGEGKTRAFASVLIDNIIIHKARLHQGNDDTLTLRPPLVTWRGPSNISRCQEVVQWPAEVQAELTRKAIEIYKSLGEN